ncbi:MAG: diaminopimelate epimerase [Clostridiales bacterium]|nr:diaminopimelate epimerase [Clostridiales bacterium]
MKFTKMHGAGNDYIYVNCFEEKIKDRSKTAIKVSDRHFGIGADGLICIDPSEIADCKMDMYNADGSQGKMCGNGVRCVAKFAYDNGIAKKDEIAVETLSGIKYIKVFTGEDGKVCEATVNMGQPVFKPSDIPALFDGDRAVDEKMTVCGKEYGVTLVSMGNPHCITYVDDVYGIDIEKIGPVFENYEKFPDRINTEFIKVVSPEMLEMRVWERGSGETLACGTGACASVAASVLNGYCKKDTLVTVKLLGGELKIKWSSEDGNIYMTGPAATVCTGETDE